MTIMTIVSLHQKLEKKTIFNRLAHHTIHGAHNYEALFDEKPRQ
jgi:hypothetical protein